MKIKIILVISALVALINVTAQNYETDAVLFSALEYNSTARQAGVGGAFTSVGANFGAISLNPANLGVYRRSEFLVSAQFHNINTTADFQNESTNANRLKFGVPNVSIVIAKPKKLDGVEMRSGFIGFNYAFGVNRVADFNNRVKFSGLNSTNSITDNFVNELSLYPREDIDHNNYSFDAVNNYYAWLANEYAVDTFGTTDFRTPVQGTIKQGGHIKTSGGIHEMLVAFSGNVSNKVYFGGSMGFPFLRYRSERIIIEEDVNNNIAFFDKLEQNQTYESKGAGFNAKFGMIYKPNRHWRIGASIASPTYYSLEENYSLVTTHELDSTVTGTDTENGVYKVTSPQGVFDYRLNTPWRVNAGAAIFIKRSGFISVDYEYVNYANAEYDFNAENEALANQINAGITGKYAGSSNIRIGGEYAKDDFRARLGYGWYGSPFKGKVADNIDLQKQTISAGLGWVNNDVSFDIAYIHSISDYYYAPYTPVDGSVEPGVSSKQHNSRLMCTLGIRFK